MSGKNGKPKLLLVACRWYETTAPNNLFYFVLHERLATRDVFQTTPTSLRFAGIVRVKVAPWSIPSLCTVREPAMSFALSDPLCSPKPWPSFFVVNPWVNIRVIFSGEIHTPVSLTSSLIHSVPCSSIDAIRTVSMRDRSVTFFIACLALLTKFTNTCRTWCLPTMIFGTGA